MASNLAHQSVGLLARHGLLGATEFPPKEALGYGDHP